jgi:hypothetical protein
MNLAWGELKTTNRSSTCYLYPGSVSHLQLLLHHGYLRLSGQQGLIGKYRGTYRGQYLGLCGCCSQFASICLPEIQEQQKIADNLSSLDDLITAQTQKLDALKTHKKGMMQQLFPSPEEVEA